MSNRLTWLRPSCAVVAIALLAACAARPAGTTTSPDALLQPGSKEIAHERLHNGEQRTDFLMRRPGADSSERRVSGVRRSLHPAGNGQLLWIAAYEPPFASLDSLWVDARTLRPEREVLAFNGQSIALTYRGRDVNVVARHGDSTRAVTRSYPFDVFAFNQVEMLIRTLPLCAGYSRVVPLFSEVDAALERDTISVESPPAAGRWTVRFADPVIVQEYTVDAATRAVVARRTVQRKSGVRMREAPIS